MGDWMTRAANKTTDAINDGPAHVVTDLYRDPNVKAALEKLFNYKCAYCETPGFAGFSWDVEHFRPKARLPRTDRIPATTGWPTRGPTSIRAASSAISGDIPRNIATRAVLIALSHRGFSTRPWSELL